MIYTSILTVVPVEAAPPTATEEAAVTVQTVKEVTLFPL